LLLAGIDIGTNTLRLLIAEVSKIGISRRIESRRHITRLGEDISRRGRLNVRAMERTMEVLEIFSRLCSKYPLDGLFAVATSAVREASNGTEFIREIKEKTGLDVVVISGDEEARLTMLGVSSGMNMEERDFLLMDIGGGSTEFVFASQGEIKFKVSTDIGVVRFTEEYIHSDPPEAIEIEKLKSAVEERLRTLPIYSSDSDPSFSRGEGVGKMNLSPFSVTFVGTAGTVTTLAAIEQQMTMYDPERIHGYRLEREGIRKIGESLSRMTIKERRTVPGIEEGREDIIIAGASITEKVMEWFGFDEMIVSDYGLREGLVIDLYNRLSLSGSRVLP